MKERKANDLEILDLFSVALFYISPFIANDIRDNIKNSILQLGLQPNQKTNNINSFTGITGESKCINHKKECFPCKTIHCLDCFIVQANTNQMKCQCGKAISGDFILKHKRNNTANINHEVCRPPISPPVGLTLSSNSSHIPPIPHMPTMKTCDRCSQTYHSNFITVCSNNHNTCNNCSNFGTNQCFICYNSPIPHAASAKTCNLCSQTYNSNFITVCSNNHNACNNCSNISTNPCCICNNYVCSLGNHYFTQEQYLAGCVVENGGSYYHRDCLETYYQSIRK